MRVRKAFPENPRSLEQGSVKKYALVILAIIALSMLVGCSCGNTQPQPPTPPAPVHNEVPFTVVEPQGDLPNQSWESHSPTPSDEKTTSTTYTETRVYYPVEFFSGGGGHHHYSPPTPKPKIIFWTGTVLIKVE